MNWRKQTSLSLHFSGLGVGRGEFPNRRENLQPRERAKPPAAAQVDQVLLGACWLSPSAPTAHTHIPHTPSKREVPGAHALTLILSAELGEITESLKFHSFPMVIIVSPP